MKSWLRANADVTVAFFLMAIVLITHYPGQMSFDSLMQFGQAVTGLYRDWHPPTMTVIWRATNLIVYGPFGMMLFHNILFFSAVILLARLTFESTLSRCLLLFAFTIFPPFFTQLGVIWKDTGLNASLLLGSVLMIYIDAHHCRRRWFVLPLICFFYGFSVRYNSLPALIPLAIWAGSRFLKTSPRATLTALGLGAAILAFFVVTSTGITRLLVGDRRDHPMQILYVEDLGGITANAGSFLFPKYVETPALNLNVIQQVYHADPAEAALPVIEFDHTKQDELREAWMSAIRNHPGAYIKHRLRGFRSILRIGATHSCYPWHHGIDANSFGLHFEDNFLYHGYYKAVGAVRDSWIFRGWPYFLMTLLAAGLALWKRNDIAFYIAASGAGNCLAYLVFFPECHFRYLYWTVTAAIVSGLLVWRRSIKPRVSFC